MCTKAIRTEPGTLLTVIRCCLLLLIYSLSLCTVERSRCSSPSNRPRVQTVVMTDNLGSARLEAIVVQTNTKSQSVPTAVKVKCRASPASATALSESTEGHFQMQINILGGSQSAHKARGNGPLIEGHPVVGIERWTQCREGITCCPWRTNPGSRQSIV